MSTKRLADLEPQWVGGYPDRTGIGVMFNCPVHGKDSCDNPRMYVPFRNPVDGKEHPMPFKDGPKWDRAGDTFDSLTCRPSVHYVGHWHGFITDGQVSTV